MLFIQLLKFLFSIFSVPGCGERVERKCLSSNNPTGVYLGIDYQIVYVTEKHFLELECQACNEPPPGNVNITWSLVDFNGTAVYPIYDQLDPKSRKFKNHMEILENNALRIDKVKSKHNGLYSCNSTRQDTTENVIVSITFNYLVQVNKKKTLSQLPSGSLTEWDNYRNNILDVAAAKLDEESLEDQIAGLGVQWSNWTDCLCGSFKFDTRRFRTAYPYLVVNESYQNAPIFPIPSTWLEEFYPFFANIVQNITPFSEYERCIEDCVPDALEIDVDYKYEQSVYLPEGSDARFTCPDSDNSNDILWVLNEEKVLVKQPNALGTTDEENHVAVDMSDLLYLVKVRQSEAGVYSCIVDSMPIKKIMVTVIPKSIFLSKDFLQCILTIAYVLIFCFTVCVLILSAKIYHIYSLYKK